jgi:hypothetical protein
VSFSFDGFHPFRQGNFSINDYSCKMKGMANKIRSLGEELSDRHLVLQLLRGLSKKYDYMKALIKCTESLPSFHVVWNDLELEELDMETEADPASATVLYALSSTRQQQQQHAAPTASSMPPPSYAPTDGPPHPTAPLANTNTSGASTGRVGGALSWPSFYTLWMGSVITWLRPRPPQ